MSKLHFVFNTPPTTEDMAALDGYNFTSGGYRCGRDEQIKPTLEFLDHGKLLSAIKRNAPLDALFTQWQKHGEFRNDVEFTALPEKEFEQILSVDRLVDKGERVRQSHTNRARNIQESIAQSRLDVDNTSQNIDWLNANAGKYTLAALVVGTAIGVGVVGFRLRNAVKKAFPETRRDTIQRMIDDPNASPYMQKATPEPPDDPNGEFFPTPLPLKERSR